ncbi:MAG: hypothetical protein ACYC3X_08845 [Pirellulaceae bacterium]
MILILAIPLCVAIVIAAIAAERSARASHRWRALVLNLLGLSCLGIGLLAVYGWSHSRSVVISHRVAMVEQPLPVERSRPASSLVRLLVDNEGRSVPAADVPAADVPAVPVAADPAPSAADVEAAATPGPESTVDVPGLERSAEQPVEQPAKTGPDGVGVDGVSSKQLLPQVEIDYAARPDWVDREDRDEGSVHQISVSSGPYLRQREARKELDRQLKLATEEYINEFLANAAAARWLSYDATRIRQTLVPARNIYDEKVISPSFGVMYQSHALLELGPDFHRDIEQAWHQIVARAQLAKLTLAAVAVLGTLVLLFSYFHADTATRGFYSGRLKFVTAVAILGLVASGVWLARSIPWLWP